MNLLDVRIAFPSGLVSSYLDLLLSFDYPLRVLIPFNLIAKASRASGILNTLFKSGLHISPKDRKHMAGNVYFKMYGYGLLSLSLE